MGPGAYTLALPRSSRCMRTFRSLPNRPFSTMFPTQVDPSGFPIQVDRTPLGPVTFGRLATYVDRGPFVPHKSGFFPFFFPPWLVSATHSAIQQLRILSIVVDG